jgi:hypothetical protein
MAGHPAPAIGGGRRGQIALRLIVPPLPGAGEDGLEGVLLLMQPTNAGGARRRPHPTLPAATMDRRLSQGRLQLTSLSLGRHDGHPCFTTALQPR